MIKAICVYCGSAAGNNPEFENIALELGTAFANRNIRLVFGGGQVGLMGACADACLEAGGEVEGVIPKALMELELAHSGVQKMHVVESMHDRKALMMQLSDAFIAMPGGIGTLDELFEIWTWRQLGMHDKPIGVLNVDGYWQPLRQLIDSVRENGLMPDGTRELVCWSDNITELLEQLAAN
ncbi:MAG: LOG family protein [Planctomycetota bacterium]|jgi:uncharacterized protein (TIGR00730 family)